MQYMDYNNVNDRLAVGADLSPDLALAQLQVQELVDAGVTAVIDCRVEAEDEAIWAAFAPEVAYLHVPVADGHGMTMPDWAFRRVVDFASEQLEFTNSKLYVHCHMGVNRGPTMAMTVLMTQFAKTPLEAYNEILAARDVAFIAFAEDAALWHLRQFMDSEGAEFSTSLEELLDRIDEVRTPQEIGRINREIIARHAAYDKALRNAQMQNSKGPSILTEVTDDIHILHLQKGD